MKPVLLISALCLFSLILGAYISRAEAKRLETIGYETIVQNNVCLARYAGYQGHWVPCWRMK